MANQEGTVRCDCENCKCEDCRCVESTGEKCVCECACAPECCASC